MSTRTEHAHLQAVDRAGIQVPDSDRMAGLVDRPEMLVALAVMVMDTGFALWSCPDALLTTIARRILRDSTAVIDLDLLRHLLRAIPDWRGPWVAWQRRAEGAVRWAYQEWEMGLA